MQYWIVTGRHFATANTTIIHSITQVKTKLTCHFQFIPCKQTSLHTSAYPSLNKHEKKRKMHRNTLSQLNNLITNMKNDRTNVVTYGIWTMGLKLYCVSKYLPTL